MIQQMKVGCCISHDANITNNKSCIKCIQSDTTSVVHHQLFRFRSSATIVIIVASITL